jgi:parallel beta-helix repeat protein
MVTAGMAMSLMFISACEESEQPSQTVFRGNPIEGNKTGVLGLGGSPYLAVDTLRVPTGSELIIEPGVELRFEPGIPFEVRGKLIAEGTEAAPITFTSGQINPARGDWDGIWLMDASPECRFEYCKFLFGAKYGRRYHYSTDNGELDSTLWEYGSVTCIRSSPTVSHCWFLAGGFHGLHCDSSANPLLENSVFYDNAGHGVFVHWSADPQIRYNIIIENDDYGLFCYEQGQTQRSDIQLDYNIVWSNFSGEFNQVAPSRLGREVQRNGNLDSCDYRFNLRNDPVFVNAADWDFHLTSGSAAIDAGPEDPAIRDVDQTRIELGVFPYHYRPGEIRRLITVDQLTANRSPYYMSYDVLLRENSTLTIEPGVEILVEGRYMFRAKGRLISNGTASQPVVIRSAVATPSLGDWIGLIFEAGGDHDTLRYTTIANAVTGISLNQRDAVFDHCTIRDSESYGIYCNDYSAPLITDCIISNNYFVGVLCRYNSSPTIHRCRITGGAGYGIQAQERSRPTIKNCIITGAATTGIRLENLSNATIVNNTLALNGYFGIYCRNNSSPEISNNIFYKNGTELRGGTGVIAEQTSLPVIDYNCFWGHPVHAVDISGNTTLTGTNIQTDPLFADVERGDFHLRDDSPCLTSGDPDIGPQMGAYGGPEVGE